MLNIKTIRYRMIFLEEITFKEEPEIAIYKAIYNRLRKILCINPDGECISCTYSIKCLYSYLSSQNFNYVEELPIIVHRPLFSKRSMKAEDILDIELTFLGDAIKHMDFFNFTLKEFEARGLFKEKYKFVIIRRDINRPNIIERSGRTRGINILTPIDIKDNIFLKEKEKIDNLNKLYNITDRPIDSIEEDYKFNAIEFKIKNPLKIGARKLMQEGYVGTIDFDEPIEKSLLLDIINIIGAGKFYAIGGGAVEIL